MEVLSPGTHFLSLEHQHRLRKYVVYVPPTGKPRYPVVLAFHGAGGTARTMLHHSRWLHHADLNGFVVVAPQGTTPKLEEKPSFRLNPQLWNLGSPGLSSMIHYADDVGFVKAILDTLPKQLDIDPHRIYATGFSNGAGLTFRLAGELGERLAAISPVAGLPASQMRNPTRPIPTWCFYSSLDPLVPWKGGLVTSPWTGKLSDRPPVLELLQNWGTESGFRPDFQLLQKTDHFEEVQLGINQNAVFLYSFIHGLGHHWPGGKDVGVSLELLGPRIKTIDATEKIWAFFTNYSTATNTTPLFR